jgi:hypothetical protein
MRTGSLRTGCGRMQTGSLQTAGRLDGPVDAGDGNDGSLWRNQGSPGTWHDLSLRPGHELRHMTVGPTTLAPDASPAPPTRRLNVTPRGPTARPA